MEQRKTWRGELAENGLLYAIAAGMVGAIYTLGRLTHLIGVSLLAAILVIVSLHLIPHLA